MKKMDREDFIEAKMTELCLSRKEVEDMMDVEEFGDVYKPTEFKIEKRSDFTDDGNSFKTDGPVTKNYILTELARAWEKYIHADDPVERERMHKMYMELLKYAEGFNDFTDDEEKTIKKWMKEEGMSRDEAEELLALTKFGK